MASWSSQGRRAGRRRPVVPPAGGGGRRRPGVRAPVGRPATVAVTGLRGRDRRPGRCPGGRAGGPHPRDRVAGRTPGPVGRHPRLSPAASTGLSPGRVCRTGCPRRGCAPPPTGGWPELARAPLGWRSRSACPARPAPAGRAGSRSRRPSAPSVGQAARRPPPGCPRSRPAGRRRGGWRGAGTAASGMPPASVTTDRFSPCLRRSTGLGPATCPPQGALVMHPSTASWSSSSPKIRS
jgi:hypothetical protein